VVDHVAQEQPASLVVGLSGFYGTSSLSVLR
jgi:hypothetical protein